MIRLSVNVNKVATLRNARGGSVPSVSDAVAVCLAAGVPGITVHPRADERHITRQDVAVLAVQLGTASRPAVLPRSEAQTVEFNIEGDPRADFVDLVVAARPHQCTLVPVGPGEVTSQAGWSAGTSPERLTAVIARLHAEGIRVSIFVDPEEAPVRWAKRLVRIGLSSTPSRSRRRLPAAATRGVPVSTPTRPRPCWPIHSGWV
jgi:pyridoxine 5-phosphate synthase